MRPAESPPLPEPAPGTLPAAVADTRVDVFLSSEPLDDGTRRGAAVAVLVAVTATLLLAPFAARPMPRVPMFLPLHNGTLFALDLAIAALLLGQFLVQRAPAILVLVAAYVFSAAMAAAHTLAYSHLVAASSRWATGEQTVAWLYFIWHGGLGLIVTAYGAVLRSARWTTPLRDAPLGRIALAGCLLPVLAALAGLLLTTAAHDTLPQLMSGDADLPVKRLASVITLALMGAALPALLVGRRRSVLDAWLGVAICIWLCEVVLESLVNDGRYSFGWYAGRIFGVVGAAALVLALIVQVSRNNLRLIEALALAERQRTALDSGQRTLSSVRRAESEALQQAAAARRAADDMRRLSAARLQAREDERRRLARDLHDDFGQTLAAIKMDVQGAATRLETLDDEAAAQLHDAERNLDRAMGNMRRIVSDLRPTVLDDLGFREALEWLVDDIRERHGVDCSLSVEPAAIDVPEPCSTAAFRIVQESLHNIVRHSGATQAELEVRLGDQALALRIHDNGRGFDPAQPLRTGAAGLVGMRERAMLLGGRVWIDSSLDHGTTVEVWLPLGDA